MFAIKYDDKSLDYTNFIHVSNIIHKIMNNIRNMNKIFRGEIFVSNY
jgi:hypothetical protein